MSGDVQPRKRKDKKKKKDDLGTEEPRGTAAALGEGDVFMHSYQDHGTGGHWCAKIIFFSLLAVLVTLIGLIILENRGLTELEANSVESRYSGVLEGWIEDAIDDHHDEHTLELKHHDDDEDHPDDQLDENEAEEESLEEEVDHNDDDHSNEDEHESDEIEDEDNTQNEDEDEEDEMQNDEDGIDDDDDDEDEIQNDDDEEGESHNDEEEGQDEDSDDEEIEENLKNEDDEEETDELNNYEEISKSNEYDDEDDERDVEEQTHDYLSKEMTSHYNYPESYEDNGDDDESKENKYDDENESNEHNTEDEASEEDDQGDDEDDEQEIEKIEKEIIDGDDSEELPDNYAPARDASKESVKEDTSKEDDEPPIEKISRPQGRKPFVEIEEETPVKPVDTLAEEVAYERQQEELRRQEEEAPHSLWLKLCVGGALLAATHALVRRATRPDAPETEEPIMEETPSLTDRRMTIIDEPIRVTQTSLSQAPRQIVDEEVFKRPAPDEEVFKRPAPVSQSAPISKPKIEEEIVKEVVAKVLELPKIDTKKEEEKELYSEEEEDEIEEDEDEDVEEDNKLPQKAPVKKQEAEESEPEAEPEEVSDVEIIYDETVEEEEIPDEEIEEEEISDVDDAELLSRLEAKYGRLPEPERPGQYKGGGNSLEAEWPGEPSDSYWRSQLETAEEEFGQGRWAAAAARAGSDGLAGCGRARWLRARALDRAADHARDNRLLAGAVTAYLHLLKMNEALSDERLLEVARRTVDRIQFTGAYLRAEPVYRLLIRRFPDDVIYRNNLTISFLMANRADLADEVLRETLRLWPNDRVALAHHGFVLKTHYNKLEEAVEALRKALDGDAGRANEPRFYYHLGDALLMLGRFDEAHEVHKRGAELGHFLSPSQRSLYNVPRLRGRPWWRIEDTPYIELARALEESWRDILKEGQAAVALYEQEKEGLRERGEWSQLDIFVRGREVDGRCARAPAVCAALRGAERGAGEGCRRGQVKFSMMTPGTHVRPHVGPTNCRLRMHLALSNTEGTYIRVDKEIRQWQLGKTFIFDDSFEHEVWHNGTGTRLVLIVDVWHPDLTAAERRQLPAI